MNNTGRTTLAFLAVLGIGAGLAALFAPQSGEETREWIADTAERKFKVLHRRGPGRSDSYKTQWLKGRKGHRSFEERQRSP